MKIIAKRKDITPSDIEQIKNLVPMSRLLFDLYGIQKEKSQHDPKKIPR